MTRQQALQTAKPILFNTEMVRAILDGRKTVTRLVIKDQHQWELDTLTDIFACIEPPYQVGDILYIRETFAQAGEHIFWYKSDDNPQLRNILWSPSIHMPKEAARIFLRVTDVRVERLQDITGEQVLKEGIRATAANVFDLGNDYITEGIDRGVFQTLWNINVKKSDLDKYGWNANPWVWVIEFERLEVE